MIKKKIKEIIKKLDVFAQPATFRYGEEPEYASLTGGIISIVMIIVFISIFFNTVLRTMKRQDISAQYTYIQEEDPSYYTIGTDNFMFAIGLQGFNLNQGKKWFDVYMQKRQYSQANKGRKSIPLNLTKCNKDQWIKLKPSLSQAYDNLDFNNFLCPTQGTIFQLQGKYSSDQFKFYKIGVKACTPTADRQCVNNTDIEAYLNKDDAFKFNFYYLNALLNPDNQEYLGTYLSTENYFLFTPKNGVLANFYLSSYSIDTDQSILPYQNNYNQNGGISQTPTQYKNYQVRQADYVKFYLRKSSLSLSIHRSFRKIDDTLSYIGGLFSSIVFLLFFLSKYNEICYQLEVAKNLFHYEKNTPLKSSQFNLLTFIGFVIYSFFDMICIKLPWEKMRKYDESLEQIKKQMDIRLIMKKILYAQRMAIAVFDESKAKILHLQVPLTLKQAQQIRSNHRFYDRLEKRFFDYKKIRKQEQKEINRGAVLDTPIKQKQRIDIDQNINNQIFKLNSNSSIEKMNNNPQNAKSSNNLKITKRRQLSKKKTILQKITQKLDDQTEKENQLQQMIQKMKSHVRTLQKEVDMGDIVSKKILNKFDPKLMKIFMKNNQEQQTQEKVQSIGIRQPIELQGSENNNVVCLQIQQQPDDRSKTQTRIRSGKF